jgi:aminopeptidase-like protein
MAKPATIYPLHAPPASEVGERLYSLVAALYPLHRCLTGEGLRATLAMLGEQIPLTLHEVPTGTPVLDWTVPQEWAVSEAWIATAGGRHVVDLKDSPLHVVQYSTPVRARMTLEALRPHLHTLPDQPDLVPYRTSYYEPAWGFCLAQRALDRLAAEGGEHQDLEVCIASRHFDGALSYGECVLPGETTNEVLFSAHACHPALANDNASALAVAAALAQALRDRPRRRYTYRFLFAPGTIGAVTWLARNREALGRLRHGLVLANLGDHGGFTYKQTRRGTLDGPQPVDRAVALALREEGLDVRPFDPFGYDERQFDSPGFDLPVGRLTRTPHGEYPAYHTSGDDLRLVTPAALEGSLRALLRVVDVLEGDAVYRSTAPFGEPQLGRRGLYGTFGGGAVTPAEGPAREEAKRALLWVLNLADGRFSLLDVAERSGLSFAAVRAAADRLLDAGLLKSVAP